MPDYSLPKYDKARDWIRNSREHNITWNEIMLARRKNEEELSRFLENQVMDNYWEPMTVEDWMTIVQKQRDAEENMKRIDLQSGVAQIYYPHSENAVTIPEDPASSWQLYKNKLLKDGFKKESVAEIESASLKILKRLSSDTTQDDPVKGLVIGNVQSGKTANMAALMAMAADWGWNVFIVLSGTIENLRIQTQNRLYRDLNQQGTIFWRSLDHLSKNVDISQRTQSLHFDSMSKERYFTVCLKNSSRLTKLIQWAQADKNKQRQMKILVIDDEADQAGINTAKIERNERKKINKLICALVNGQNEKAADIDVKYQAMNYIGYTATPYANILNEPAMESLYPRNFITTLAVSKEYFGPQQIFGCQSEDSETQFEGLNIVRTIEPDELDEIAEIHNGERLSMPESLADAVCWFMCGVSCMRIWNYKKPISMLVHTSQKTAHHSSVAEVIRFWLENTAQEVIIDRVRAVWERETSEFTLEDFRAQYPQYDRPDSDINDYPAFEEVEKQIRVILNDGVSHIGLADDDETLTYHKGIHLCIDNCTNNGITSDGMHVRLAYPELGNMPSPAPAFIVVGGATLSRGLTIEGLMSTFFLRSVGQADTLMQMGRWFGYRKNYELLPRLWITEKTKAQFEFLAALDQELRDEIQRMDVNGRSPAEYGPKVKNTPKLSFIRITAKNRMQSARESDMDYSGCSNQAYMFDNNRQVLEANIQLTEEFLSTLGECWTPADPYGLRKGSAVWRNVGLEKVRAYLEKFQFCQRLKVFNDTKPLMDWLDKVTEAGKLGTWTVAVMGKKEQNGEVWSLPNGIEIGKVKRTRRLRGQEEIANRNIINIGVLRNPRDLLVDVDMDSTDIGEEDRREVIDYLKSDMTKAAAAFRDKSGLETTPQMLIYRVDKNSRMSEKMKASSKGLRDDLNAVEDLVGICLYIPGGRRGTSYASSVSMKMDNDLFDGDADMEGTDED